MNDAKAYRDWELFRSNLMKETVFDIEDYAVKEKRIQTLKANYEDWFKYYFPVFYTSEPANFHKKASKRFIETPEIYEVRAWARELAKSVRAMMEIMYLTLTGKAKNVLIISNTNKSACNLLTPYRIVFEANQRIINDYGEQRGVSKWEESHFLIRSGISFYAFGAGESPRGTRNEAIRPDIIVFDDIDTDEEVRNTDRINNKWAWIEKAVIPTVSVSGSKRILFLGNIIGKDTCITRAIERADHADIINIRDKNGKSTWPQKNSEERIDWLLSKISFAAGQQEYFNNPVTEGSVFKQITFGKCPPLVKFKMLVSYGDPAPSNRENKNNSFKSNVLIGEADGVFYVVKCFLDHVVNAGFVNWYYHMESFVNGRTTVYYYIENNALQDPFYEQVFKPLFAQEAVRTGKIIPVVPDERKKPDKFTRIEGNLEPLNRLGNLVFNEAEKDNPHMKQLTEQFLCVDPQLSAPADGPDAVEGAVWILNNKLRRPSVVDYSKFKRGNNKY